jgi:hypothetical protein
VEIVDEPGVKMEKTELAQPSLEVAGKVVRDFPTSASTRPQVETVAIKEEKTAKTTEMEPTPTPTVPPTLPASQNVSVKVEQNPPATTRRQLRPEPSVVIIGECELKPEKTEIAPSSQEAVIKL